MDRAPRPNNIDKVLDHLEELVKQVDQPLPTLLAFRISFHCHFGRPVVKVTPTAPFRRIPVLDPLQAWTTLTSEPRPIPRRRDCLLCYQS
jgi:hypothetical protein